MSTSMEKAKQLNKQIRERNQRTVYSSDHFQDMVTVAQTHLQESLTFLQQASLQPLLFFTQTKEKLQSTHSMLFRAIDYKARLDGNGMGSQHDLQAFMADRMNACLQKWGVEQGVDTPIKVEVRNPLSFPSIYCVFYGDLEVVQFSIFDQWYGVRMGYGEEQEIIDHSKRTEQDYREQAEEQQKKIEEYEHMLQHPFSIMKTTADLWILLFKKRQLMEGIQRRIQIAEARKQELLKQADDIAKELPIQLQSNRERKEGIERIVPFFQKFGYTKQTNTHLLY